MTIDEEMKDLSAKAAKASRKEEKCKNNVQFPIVFAIKPCRDRGSKSEKRYLDAFNNAYERAEHAIFKGPSWCVPISRIVLPT